METIFISKDKLKIMLTHVEMEKYRIDSNFSKDKNEADLVIWDILDDAAANTGFDTQKGSFYVQMYPSKDGGCELFVTRINCDASTEDNGLKRSANEKYKATKQSACKKATDVLMKTDGGNCNIPLREKKYYIYSFDNFEAFLGACKELSVSKKVSDSKGYTDSSRDRFFLLIDKDSEQPSEFGGVKCKATELPYITEHCKLFSSDAVSDLSQFALWQGSDLAEV